MIAWKNERQGRPRRPQSEGAPQRESGQRSPASSDQGNPRPSYNRERRYPPREGRGGERYTPSEGAPRREGGERRYPPREGERRYPREGSPPGGERRYPPRQVDRREGGFRGRPREGGYSRPQIPNDRGGYDRAMKRERFMTRSKESVMEALRSRDMLLASVTKAQDDLDKTINLLGERLEDWYGIYFPELRAEDKLKYAEVSLIIDRE